MNQCTKPTQKLSKEVKTDNFCYCKVGRAITKSKQKSNIAIAKLENYVKIDSVLKLISHFWGTNHISVDCRLIY